MKTKGTERKKKQKLKHNIFKTMHCFLTYTRYTEFFKRAASSFCNLEFYSLTVGQHAMMLNYVNNNYVFSESQEVTKYSYSSKQYSLSQYQMIKIKSS